MAANGSLWVLLAGALAIGFVSIVVDVYLEPAAIGDSIAEFSRLLAGLLLTLFAGAWLWEAQEASQRKKLVALVGQELDKNLEDLAVAPAELSAKGRDFTAQLVHFHEMTYRNAVNSGLLPLPATAVLTQLTEMQDLYQRVSGNLLLSMELADKPKVRLWEAEGKKLEGLRQEILTLVKQAQQTLAS